MKSVRTLDNILRKGFRDCLEIERGVKEVCGTSETWERCQRRAQYVRDVCFQSTRDVSECLRGVSNVPGLVNQTCIYRGSVLGCWGSIPLLGFLRKLGRMVGIRDRSSLSVPRSA
ncbi:UNVERIFIED_CONTAM: hypothetical protein Slati_4219800 [Sesamum latifolium]|uniref:Uncharacterized protein n=1 Tax=Sesamum latifolium TaxID=2727402 RepID=A0AAW2TBS8_9LAMI